MNLAKSDKEMTKSSSSVLEKHDIFYLTGHIGRESCDPLVKWILAKNLQENRPDELKIIINSPGGHIWDMFAVIDTIDGSSIPISTIGLGIISSASFCIFIAGTKGRRVLTPNTSILSHQFSWGSWGKHHELIAAKEEFGLIHDRIIKHYKRHTGLTKKRIERELLPAHDRWLSAEQALDLGVCDEVRTL